jgi:hypothetical protein
VLKVVLRNVKPDKVDRLRWWLGELNRRQDEVRETFARETIRHEMGYLVEGREGPLLVYAMEAEDFEQAGRAFRESRLPIDLEHRQIMEEVLEPGPAKFEKVYECAVDQG